MRGNRVLVSTPEGGTLQWRARPHPASGQVVVRVHLAGVCRTDVAVERGALPAVRPVVLGHELTGRVVEAGAGAEAWLDSDVVVMPVRPDGTMLGVDRDGAFGRYVVVDAARLECSPPGVDPRSAVFAEPVAACLAPRSLLSNGGAVHVLGEGRIAALTQRCLSVSGVPASLGPALPASRVDALVETTGAVVDLDPLLDRLHRGGVLILKSRRMRAVRLDAARLLRRALTVRGADYAPFSRAVQLLSNPQLQLPSLWGPVFSLDDWQAAFAHPESTKAFIDPWAEG